MAFSLGLMLYGMAARPEGVRTAPPPRPGGSLVWVHAPGPALAPMLELARRLIEEDGISVLLTCGGAPATEAIIQPPPEEVAADLAGFFDHWRPEMVVMAGAELRPLALHEAGRRGLPVIMVEAGAPHLLRSGWFPGLMKTAAQSLARVLVLDDLAARAWRKAGVDPERLMVVGRMEEPSAALPHVEADRQALARGLAARPIWLAADISEEEEPAVIAAHREALKLAHRLLLILVPRNPARTEALAARLDAEEGWHVACRSRDEEPEAESEVFVGSEGELGLWYRLAPVTFLGGSLSDGCRRNPMETAAMGSAILCGPKAGAHEVAFARLGAARATRMVGSGADLAQALGDLLSPDRAARQAQAAWSIASEGAEVTERVMGLVRDVLDGGKL